MSRRRRSTALCDSRRRRFDAVSVFLLLGCRGVRTKKYERIESEASRVPRQSNWQTQNVPPEINEPSATTLDAGSAFLQISKASVATVRYTACEAGSVCRRGRERDRFGTGSERGRHGRRVVGPPNVYGQRRRRDRKRCDSSLYPDVGILVHVWRRGWIRRPVLIVRGSAAPLVPSHWAEVRAVLSLRRPGKWWSDVFIVGHREAKRVEVVEDIVFRLGLHQVGVGQGREKATGNTASRQRRERLRRRRGRRRTRVQCARVNKAQNRSGASVQARDLGQLFIGQSIEAKGAASVVLARLGRPARRHCSPLSHR